MAEAAPQQIALPTKVRNYLALFNTIRATHRKCDFHFDHREYHSGRSLYLPTIAQIVLESTAAMIALGGLYDLFAPRLPSNLIVMCSGDEQACKLVRELLRALGGSLVAVGATVAILVGGPSFQDRQRTLLLVMLLVLPSEGINCFSMHRVGSPFLIPLAFILLTLLVVFLAWPHSFF